MTKYIIVGKGPDGQGFALQLPLFFAVILIVYPLKI